MQPGRGSPQWQPIERLTLLGEHIDGMLEAANENYETLQEARPKPHVLDNDTVRRVIDVFTTQQKDLWLFDEQLRWWQAGKMTILEAHSVQSTSADRLTARTGCAACARPNQHSLERSP